MKIRQTLLLSGLGTACLLFTGCLHMTVHSPKPDADRLPLTGKRVAFLGDSITDGHTLPILFEQSLKAAGITPPTCTNVAVCGNRASDMLARLERDVLPFHPDYVTVSAGVNDANTKVPPEKYAAEMTAIVDRLTAAGSQVILVAPTPITSAHAAEVKPRWTAYTVFLRDLAKQRGLRLAEVDQRFEEAIAAGQTVMGGDGIHIDFPGYLVMTRSLLDTMGYRQVPVVPKMQVSQMPGVISPWKIRAAPAETPLTATESAALAPDAAWKTLALPQEPKAAEPGGWWLEQERQRGFAVGVDLVAGNAKRYQGFAEIASPQARQVYLNTGGSLETIWLNGAKVFQNPTLNSGWHPGKERIAVTLRPGANQIVIETGTRFFLSLTDDNKW